MQDNSTVNRYSLCFFSVYDMPEFCFGVEICEDLWTPDPPSTMLAKNGALIIANLSASDEVIGKADYRRMLVKATSARLVSAYVYSSAGQGESTQDLVFSGHDLHMRKRHYTCRVEKIYNRHYLRRY